AMPGDEGVILPTVRQVPVLQPRASGVNARPRPPEWLHEIPATARSLPALLEQFGDEAGPAGLMVGPKAGAVVAVEVFIEQNQIAPIGIALEDFGSPSDGPAARVVAQENADQTARNFRSDPPEVGFPVRV